VDVRLSLVEFPADDPERALRFWTGLLGAELEDRSVEEGRGWQTRSDSPTVGVHRRGTGPGDTVSLPYFAVSDLDAALERVRTLGGSVIHPGSRWAICRDSEGSPFGLALDPIPRRIIPVRLGQVRAVGAKQHSASDPSMGQLPYVLRAPSGTYSRQPRRRSETPET
jgi:predicted enzyme related to lactoylglutathione lyase